MKIELNLRDDNDDMVETTTTDIDADTYNTILMILMILNCHDSDKIFYIGQILDPDNTTKEITKFGKRLIITELK
jgi:hypothetical protein